MIGRMTSRERLPILLALSVLALGVGISMVLA
jgi:hypothetical protein